MDNFPDRTCPMSSWSHMGGLSRASWDFNDKIIPNAESLEAGVGNHKASGTGQTSGSQTGATKDTINYPLEDNMQLLLEDQLMTSRLLYQQGYQGSLEGLTDGSASQALSVAAIYSQALATSQSVGSSGAEISNGQQPSGGQLPSAAATWCQPFVGGTIPLQFGAKTELFLQQQTQAGGPQNSLLTAIGGTKSSQPQTGVLASQRPQEETSLSVSGGRVGLSQPQSATTVAGGAARPRVRARRGQATDPHSIAERLRRERIADRMKSLQELVPNANKADRASMLDEIIDYVKFLQLQVKVLSMSRLGGTGAVTPLLSDLTPEGLLSPGIVQNSGASSSQDGLAVIERQVARLMEENMGSAMQYLQGKGLCLMPLSVAAAISRTNATSQTINQLEAQSLTPGECRQMDLTGATPASSKTTNMTFGSMATSPNSSEGIGSDSTMKSCIREGNQGP